MNEESKFQVGVEVALVSTHWQRTISKRIVHKVHKNGRFFIASTNGIPSEQMWTPRRNGEWADKSGDSTWSREHLEVWTSEHDEELRVQADELKRVKRIGRLEMVTKVMHKGDASLDALLDALEAHPYYKTLQDRETKLREGSAS